MSVRIPEQPDPAVDDHPPVAICPICRNEMTIVPMDCPRCDGYGRDARSEGWTDEARMAVAELEEKFDIAVCSADHNERTHARAEVLLAEVRALREKCEKLASLNLAALNNLLASHEEFRRDASAQQSKLRARCDRLRKALEEVKATLSDDYSNREYITRLIDAALTEKEQGNG